MDRSVSVHYHIFKNAGCSADASLKTSFGSSRAEFEGLHAHDVQSSVRLAQFLKNSPSIDAEEDRGDLEEAKALLSGWGIAGIVETYALSVKTFQAFYGPVLPALDFKDMHINATSTASGSPEEQIERFRSLQGTALFDDFVGVNALDMALYEYAERILDRAADKAQAADPE